MSPGPDLSTKEGVTEDFVSNTSIPLIPRFQLSQLGRKVFWAIILIISLSIFLWQFSLMLGKYFSYPVSVNIEVSVV